MPAAATHMPPTIMRIITMHTITARMIMPGTTTRNTTTPMVMPMPTTMAAITSMMSIAGTSIITATTMLMTTNKPPPAKRGRRAAEAAATPELPAVGKDSEAALYRLMTWLSPSFPVGAFSYSSGIEWAVESGDIVDAASLQDWLAAMLAHGSGFCDGVFLAQAHRAAMSGDEAALGDTAELAAAFVPSRERQLETSTQGQAFITIARSAWNCDGLDRMIAGCDGAIVYPVAVGIVSAAHAIPLTPTVQAFLHALVSNWISAGARLVPLGQTDSQRVLAALEPVVATTGARVLTASLDDLGSATFRADLASMRHETQYTRLFRS